MIAESLESVKARLLRRFAGLLRLATLGPWSPRVSAWLDIADGGQV